MIAMADALRSGVWQVRLRVRGRVQGVFFRASTQTKAGELRLSGWVRNCADGSVQLEAFGEEAAIRALEAWVSNGGPPGASVTETLQEIPVRIACGDTPVPVGFEIRRSIG